MNFVWKKPWILIIVVGVSLLYAKVAKRLYDIQLGKKSGGIVNAMDFTKKLPARRGGIYDRNGMDRPLASSVPYWKVFIDPEVITENQKPEVMRQLAQFEEFDEDKVFSALSSKKGRYHPIGQTINRETIDVISTNIFLKRCVGKEIVTKRNYPVGSHMCHVVGIVNSVGEALDGIELKMDKYLTGTDGYIKGVASAKRREIAAKREEKVAPINGADVFLTLDRNIQYYVETALDEAMIETSARSAWAIVQDPHTGEILAMASRPNFDPDQYGSCHPEDKWNRAIFMNYEPGSTMKALTFAAGLNEHLYTTNSLINVDGGLYAGRTLQDHVQGNITLTVATQKSSNRAASRVAMALGRQKFEDYLKAFEFGRKSGIELTGESSGILSPAKSWSEVQAIRIAIGQGISVTGMQMMSLYNTIANKGLRMKPYVIDKIVASNGEILLQNRPTPLGHIFTEKTAEDTSFMLSTVTETGGTGRRAKIPGYAVAGKTGTAQIPVGGRYSVTDYTASFIGFFPAANPRVTILVALDAPKPNYHGGTVAAPVFSKIGTAIARYLEIPPDFPEQVQF